MSTASKTEDDTAPKISGARPVWLAVGADFDVMSGVSVSDDTDPNPTLAADVKTVDTSKTGTKTITYTAADADGNTSSVKRRVHIAREIKTTENGSVFPIYWNADGLSGQPYLVAVNSSLNCVTVYETDDEGRYTVPVKAMVCSVGSDTPTGYYRTLERYEWQDLFEESYGQYAIRITGHILFHSVPYDSKDPSTLQTDEYNLLGTSASHGCVRLTVADAKWLYDNCPSGFPCALYEDEDSAGPLGKPEIAKLDSSDSRSGWDPTDPDPSNPWLAETSSEETGSSKTGSSKTDASKSDSSKSGSSKTVSSKSGSSKSDS